MKLPRQALVPFIALLLSLLLFFLLKPLLFTSQAEPRPTPPTSSSLYRDSANLDLNLTGAVHLFTGTGEQATLTSAYSGGETFPGADVPFGMLQWSPDTASYAYSGYAYNDNRIRGFSLTHLSGAGCSDYGDIPFLPYAGNVTVSPGSQADQYISHFSHTDEHATPGYYSVTLSNGITTQLTVAQHSGVGLFTYPAKQTATMLVNLGGSLNKDTDSQATIGSDTIAGWVSSGNFCYLKENTYRVYFWAQFSQPFASVGTWQGGQVNQGSTSISGVKAGVFVTFAHQSQTTITERVGISFVSIANAQANVDQEDPQGNFAQIRQQAEQTWNSWLNKIHISGGNPVQAGIFYTALYHSLLFPSVFSDVNGQYLGFDQQVHTVQAGHAQYANFSGWDIYRSQIQLITLLAPEIASDMAQSLLNDYQQSGLLPRWSLANAETYVQTGDSADAIIADIYAFGGTHFAASTALQAMIKQATVSGPERPEATYLDTPGYLPSNVSYSCCNPNGPAATTLEDNTDDFAISALAGELGDNKDEAYFLQRAQDWQKLFDPATGYLEPRELNGTFSPTSNSWVEGTSAQYTWMVPFNLQGLFTKLGGATSVIKRLNTFFTQLDAGPQSNYAFLGNEPTLEVPWEYDYAGVPYKTQQLIHQIVTTLYQNGPAGLPGNDDLGEMSSWYVFAALGFYPETPGTANLVLSTPLFPAITITRDSGQTIQINAPGLSESAYYITGLKVDQIGSTRPWLPASFVAAGGTLDYTIGSTPNVSWGSSSADAPPSYA